MQHFMVDYGIGIEMLHILALDMIFLTYLWELATTLTFLSLSQQVMQEEV